MIIGFHGCKGVGKDTAAQFLIDEYGFTKVSFADQLKEAVANLFGLTREEVDKYKEVGVDGLPKMEVFLSWLNGPTSWVFSWREFLQRFGTEMARNTFGRDFWVNQWEEYLYRNSIQEDDIVVTDVRFQNEAHRIQSLGDPGIVVRITRPGHEPDGHESEEPLPSLLIDAEISNNGNLDDFKVDVYELYKGLTRGNTES